MDEFLRAKALYPVGHAVGLELSTVNETEFYKEPEVNGYVNHPGGKEGRKTKFLPVSYHP